MNPAPVNQPMPPADPNDAAVRALMAPYLPVGVSSLHDLNDLQTASLRKAAEIAHQRILAGKHDRYGTAAFRLEDWFWTEFVSVALRLPQYMNCSHFQTLLVRLADALRIETNLDDDRIQFAVFDILHDAIRVRSRTQEHTLRNLSGFPSESHWWAFLRTAARRRALRFRDPIRARSLDGIPELATAPPEDGDAAEKLELIRREVLPRLTEPQRRVAQAILNGDVNITQQLTSRYLRKIKSLMRRWYEKRPR